MIAGMQFQVFRRSRALRSAPIRKNAVKSLTDGTQRGRSSSASPPSNIGVPRSSALPQSLISSARESFPPQRGRRPESQGTRPSTTHTGRSAGPSGRREIEPWADSIVSGGGGGGGGGPSLELRALQIKEVGARDIIYIRRRRCHHPTQPHAKSRDHARRALCKSRDTCTHTRQAQTANGVICPLYICELIIYVMYACTSLCDSPWE